MPIFVVFHDAAPRTKVFVLFYFHFKIYSKRLNFKAVSSKVMSELIELKDRIAALEADLAKAKQEGKEALVLMSCIFLLTADTNQLVEKMREKSRMDAEKKAAVAAGTPICRPLPL